MDVDSIAKLAHLPVTPEEKKNLRDGFTKVLSVLDSLKKIQTKTTEPTHQVTGLENVTREDVIDASRILTQDQALSNAKRTHNGYIVVDPVLTKT